VKHIGSILSGFALTVLLISCGKEPITLKYPKVIASGDMGKIEKFVNQYSDSLQNDSKTFFNIVLKIDNFRKIFYPVHNLQANILQDGVPLEPIFICNGQVLCFLLKIGP